MRSYVVTSTARGTLDLVGPFTESEAVCVARDMRAAGDTGVTVRFLMPGWCETHDHSTDN